MSAPGQLYANEVDECVAFAAEHGIPALLDHLGLDGLANEVTALMAVPLSSRPVSPVDARADADTIRGLLTSMSVLFDDALAVWDSQKPDLRDLFRKRHRDTLAALVRLSGRVAEHERALADIEAAALRQHLDWMHFHEDAMADPFKAESQAQGFAGAMVLAARAALAARPEPPTGERCDCAWGEPHPECHLCSRLVPPVAETEQP